MAPHNPTFQGPNPVRAVRLVKPTGLVQHYYCAPRGSIYAPSARAR